MVRQKHTDEPDKPKKDSTNKYNDLKNAFKEWVREEKSPQWTAVAVAIIAVLLTSIFNLKQGCQNQTTTEADLRAYVAVNRIDTLYYKLPHEMAKISIVNYGKTPARKVVIDYIFEFLGRDTLHHLNLALRSTHLGKDEYIIAPGETYILPVRPTGTGSPDSLRFWKDPLDSLHNERHIYGIITYYDHTNTLRRTVYAFKWEFLTMSYRRVGGMNYFDCDQADPKGDIYTLKP